LFLGGVNQSPPFSRVIPPDGQLSKKKKRRAAFWGFLEKIFREWGPGFNKDPGKNQLSPYKFRGGCPPPILEVVTWVLGSGFYPKKANINFEYGALFNFSF